MDDILNVSPEMLHGMAHWRSARLGAILRARREERGLSLADCVEQTGLDEETIQAIEGGSHLFSDDAGVIFLKTSILLGCGFRLIPIETAA